GVGDSHDFPIHQDAGEGQGAIKERRYAEVLSVAGDGAEVEPAVAQGGTLLADRGDLRDVSVVQAVLREAGAAPQGFADGGIGSRAIEALLGAVVETRNARQTIQT